ncbi:hypothetical protein C8Q77DRAFT_1217323 [Trametes polyzona]|nr:hypothetical protein C8Q77DRAFT_1217323 [Trametes polyzona]
MSPITSVSQSTEVYYPTRPPAEWATGGEPMTERQRITLSSLAANNRVSIPWLCEPNYGGRNVTKAEAYILIALLLDDVVPTADYVDTLGSDPIPYDTPPHPSQWVSRNAPPTTMQLAWLGRLIDDMGVPDIVKAYALDGITRGQASLLIGRLREEKGAVRPNEESRMVVEHAAQAVRAELPAPA